jgi:hypothetical protein
VLLGAAFAGVIDKHSTKINKNKRLLNLSYGILTAVKDEWDNTCRSGCREGHFGPNQKGNPRMEAG